jgi:ribosomal-protein-alanine N-acetyltransferase
MITTSRLHISPFTAADAPFIQELLNSPPWLKYIGDRNIHSDEDALQYLEDKVLPAYASSGLAGWRVALKESDIPIGNCGFYQRDFLDHPDFGFAFLPDYLGQGYGYEAARACLDYGMKEHGVKEALAITQENNRPSIGLLKKLGFREDGTVKWPGDEKELMLFKLG